MIDKKSSRKQCGKAGWSSRWLIVIMILVLAAPMWAVQSNAGGPNALEAFKGAPEQDDKLSKELDKYPLLLPELGRVMQRLQAEVQLPAARRQSRLLPMAPGSSVIYGAFPNYGEALHQALQIVRQERQQSKVLDDWLRESEAGAAKPGWEETLEKIYQLSQYVGDEIMVSGSVKGEKGQEESFAMVAEVKKPGLKAFLLQMDRELGAKSNKPLRVVNVQELALLKPTPKGTNDPIVLVRPDLVIVGSDVATVRRLNRPTPTAVKLTATPFGQRVAQAYQSGAGILFAVDLATILKQNPATSPKDQQMLQQTGIADMKYLVWEHKDVAGQPSSQTELSFNGPRHGVVSWLGSPIALGSMNFFSPKAAVALAIALKRPSQIYDEASEMMTASGSGAFGMVGTMESQFNIDLKRDLLDKLTGEIGIEASGLGDPEPSWKAVLGVKDADGLQQTLAKVLAAIPMEVKTHDEDGITYNRLHIPNPNKPVDIHYAFVNGYLVITPSRTLMQEAVQFERSGESLGQSSRFRSALPQGYPPEASALLYENIGAMMAPILRQASPDLAKVLPLMNADAPPVVMGLYGDESSIRQANNSGSFDVSGVMIVAAIAVPNLLRARNAADESAAASTMRTINTAQVTYATTYPQRGYAPDLATLGPGGGECGNSVSDEHACLLNAELGGAACTSGSWCVKGNYRYSVAASCKEKLCEEYVAVASPAAMDGSGKSFCTTSEMVIRSRPGARLETPISVEECQSWPPIQ